MPNIPGIIQRDVNGYAPMIPAGNPMGGMRSPEDLLSKQQNQMQKPMGMNLGFMPNATIAPEQLQQLLNQIMKQRQMPPTMGSQPNPASIQPTLGSTLPYMPNTFQPTQQNMGGLGSFADILARRFGR